MTTFLFWNLKEKPLQAIIARLTLRYEVDVLMLAEYDDNIPLDNLIRMLNKPGENYDYVPRKSCQRIEIFTRFPEEFMPPIYEEDKFTIRHLKLPGLTDILLAVSHLSSKLYADEYDQFKECENLAQKIRNAEAKIGHAKTVLVGDLNMNPFESGVVNASALHAVMSRQLAKRHGRIVQGQQYPFFYNPMWSLFGDSTPGPPGTYYYSGTKQKAFFWHMFDQVLIRPELLDRFDNQDLEILQSDGHTPLLTKKGLPNRKMASDHLPILFKLNL